MHNANKVVNKYGNVYSILTTLDDLRNKSIAGVSTGEMVFVRGDQYAGDHGGGTYVYQSNGNADDDGNRVIKPNSIPSDQRGRWQGIDGESGGSNPDKIFRMNISFDLAPQANEMLYGYPVTTKFAFFKNFRGTQVNVLAPPAEDFTIFLLKNQIEIATLVFHSGGGHTFTFTTDDLNADGEVECLPGDALWFRCEDKLTDLGYTAFAILGHYILDQDISI